METVDREVKTVMHTLKRRTLTVKRVEQVAPHMRRITLTGEDLSDFVSLSPDDHVKVFFSEPGVEPPVMRDYTPRRYDKDTQELDLEFYLHGEGPGSQWALQAQVGQSLSVGGPRGSRIVPYNFDWYLMVGDETSLPSISRRLTELPEGARSVIVVEVENESEKIEFASRGPTDVHWIYRHGEKPGQVERLKQEIVKISVPSGDYFAWIACEKACAMELKEILLTIKGAKEEWIKATGYWHHAH
ncbi:MAG: siderophore-interacting protein [Bdellovibrio sp.]|nr:siderophore-interacting protein [Bdellovibrio sp.]